MRIHHIAIVVRSLRRSARFYRRLGLDSSREFRLRERYPGEPRAHVYLGRAFFDPAQGFPVFWPMQPVGRTGPLARFLDSHGPGLHHVGLACSGLARLRLPFVRRPHFFRADGEVRALLDPKETDGVLVELVERRCAPAADALPQYCIGAADHVGVMVASLAPWDRFFRCLGFARDAMARDREFTIARYRVRGFHVALFEPRPGAGRRRKGTAGGVKEGFDHVALPLYGLGVRQVTAALRRAGIQYRGPYPLDGETALKVADPSGAEWELLVK